LDLNLKGEITTLISSGRKTPNKKKKSQAQKPQKAEKKTSHPEKKGEDNPSGNSFLNSLKPNNSRSPGGFAAKTKRKKQKKKTKKTQTCQVGNIGGGTSETKIKERTTRHKKVVRPKKPIFDLLTSKKQNWGKRRAEYRGTNQQIF